MRAPYGLNILDNCLTCPVREEHLFCNLPVAAVQRVFTGEPDEKNAATRDIGFREICTVAPLLGLSLFLGLYPKPVLDRLQPSVSALVTQVETHSNHKPPAVDVASDECLVNGNGRYTVATNGLSFAPASHEVLYPNDFGPCGSEKASK